MSKQKAEELIERLEQGRDYWEGEALGNILYECGITICKVLVELHDGDKSDTEDPGALPETRLDY